MGKVSEIKEKTLGTLLVLRSIR